MARKSFAEVLKSSQLLVKSLQEGERSFPPGVTVELRDALNNLNEKIITANAEQEKLKAQLKTKTAEVDKLLTEIEERYALMKKYIKLGVKQELWREFGIEDKK